MATAHPTATADKPLSESDAAVHVHGICFKTGPPSRLGVELEWLVRDIHAPPPGSGPQATSPLDRAPLGPSPLDPACLEAAHNAARDLPLRSAITVEPGGQLELSSPPADNLTECVTTLHTDLAAVRRRLREDHQLTLVGHGLDPCHPPRRLLDEPRYRAMEAHFDRTGPAGRAMMCGSASVQVCVDAGTEEPGPTGHARRWQLAHLLGAVLLAAFANSPLLAGRPSGWRSTRQAVWTVLDGRRALAPAANDDPRAAWTAYALDTPIMCVPEPGGRTWPAPPSPNFTFRDWLRTRSPRHPHRGDLDYHLTTLFPPVRPRGHLELRMVDAQPGDHGWVVPLAVTAALFDDPAAAESAYRTVKPLADVAGDGPAPRNPLWRRAAQWGLADPELRAAATACFAAARDALPRMGAGKDVLAAVDSFTARYVTRGRCPADDVLDAVDGRRPGLGQAAAGRPGTRT